MQSRYVKTNEHKFTEFEEREALQYGSHLYCSTPPICTAVRAPFVRQHFWKNTGGWGHRNVSEFWEKCRWDTFMQQARGF